MPVGQPVLDTNYKRSKQQEIKYTERVTDREKDRHPDRFEAETLPLKNGSIAPGCVPI